MIGCVEPINMRLSKQLDLIHRVDNSMELDIEVGSSSEMYLFVSLFLKKQIFSKIY